MKTRGSSLTMAIATAVLCTSGWAIADVTTDSSPMQKRAMDRAGGGVAGESDCCVANGTPGCDDPECEAAICAVDPFCCDTSWDQLCADQAADLCDVCQSGPGGGCVGDLDDSGAVDGADLALLLGDWGPCPGCAADLDGSDAVDGADLALLLGAWGDCPEPKTPENDACSGAIDITGNIDGDPVEGDNTLASPGPGDPDVPAGSPTCHWSGAPEAIHNTLWYSFTAPDSGGVFVTSCGSTGTLNDTIIAIYSGTCGSFVEVACGEDECGAPTYFSELETVDLTPGETYYLLLANTGDWTGSTVGTFSFVIESVQAPSNCCDTAPGQVGCDDATCEDAVCAELAFCCSFEWDAECAALANEICDACQGPKACQAECPDGALDEGEACGTDTNGGCNATPPVFGAVACGDTICGTAWADAASRDTDFFEITVDATTNATAELVSQFPGVVAFFEITDPCTATFLGTFGHSDESCSVGTGTATLEPGLTYTLFVSPGLASGGGVFEGFPCGSGANDYTVTLSCE